MAELNKVFQTAKDAYEAASSYLNETHEVVVGFINLKNDLEMSMLLDENADYSSQIKQCEESRDLLLKIGKVLAPIVDQLELAYTKLKENEELLKRGE